MDSMVCLGMCDGRIGLDAPIQTKRIISNERSGTQARVTEAYHFPWRYVSSQVLGVPSVRARRVS